MRKVWMFPAALLPLLAGGCLVRTAANVVTAPVKAGGQVVDWTTTSEDEADRNYGRKARKQEAKEGRERKEAAERCRKNPNDCQPYDGYRQGYDDN